MNKISLAIVMSFGLAQSVFAAGTPQQLNVIVTEKGFEPSHLKAEAGKDVELTITRITDATCAKSVMIPSLKLKQDLPLNKPVTLKIAKLEKGELKFTCGMKMVGAVIEVQ